MIPAILGGHLRVQRKGLADLGSTGRTDAKDVSQRNDQVLVVGNVYTEETRHLAKGKIETRVGLSPDAACDEGRGCR